MQKKLKNGQHWTDTEGNPIHAHGGCILKIEDRFYWYGEDRRENYYVSCYSSKDLMNWKFENHILTTESEILKYYDSAKLINEDGRKINIERPKIIYNETSKKYVMWAHYENGYDYKEAAIAIASCDSPTGDFCYHGCFNPFQNMSRDCTLFTDKDNTPFFVSTAQDNANLNVYSLSDDYMSVNKLEKVLFQGEYREAPAFFETGGKLFLLTSKCTGWRPNQGGYAYADNMISNWSEIYDFGDETTYHTQPAFVLTLNTAKGKQYLYIGDRWGGNEWDGVDRSKFAYDNSSYYFSLLSVGENNAVSLEKCDEFTFDADGGSFKVLSSEE